MTTPIFLSCFLFVGLFLQTTSEPIDHFDTQTLFKTRNVTQRGDGDDEKSCQIPEGYYLFVVEGVNVAATATGGAYLLHGDNGCYMRAGIISTGLCSCLRGEATWPATLTGVQYYAPAALPDFEFYVLGTTYTDRLPVYLTICGDVYSGYLLRTYLKGPGLDAYNALKLFC